MLNKFKNEFLLALFILPSLSLSILSAEAKEMDENLYSISAAAVSGHESSKIVLSRHKLNLGGRVDGAALSAKVLRGHAWGRFSLLNWGYRDQADFGRGISNVKIRRIQGELVVGRSFPLGDTAISFPGSQNSQFFLGAGMGRESIPSQAIKAIYPYRALFEDFWASYPKLAMGLEYSFNAWRLGAHLEGKYTSPAAYSFRGYEAKLSCEYGITETFSGFIELNTKKSTYRDSVENNKLDTNLFSIGIKKLLQD